MKWRAVVEGLHYRIIDGYLCVYTVYVCACISPFCDQMKYSSVFMAIDQSSAAPMMDTTALIAPPMPSVSLAHILLHSHSFIYPPPNSLTPPFQLCGTQTETNHIFNEIKSGGRPAGIYFTPPDSCRIGAPDSKTQDDSPLRKFLTSILFF